MNSEVSSKRILFLAANPKGTPQLRLDEEFCETQENLKLFYLVVGNQILE
ncbi:hypothetical protein [Nostoc sp. CCY 9925]